MGFKLYEWIAPLEKDKSRSMEDDFEERFERISHDGRSKALLLKRQRLIEEHEWLTLTLQDLAK